LCKVFFVGWAFGSGGVSNCGFTGDVGRCARLCLVIFNIHDRGTIVKSRKKISLFT
jgi:hypothetical protein